MIQDHAPAELNQFNGLFGIDEFDDSVPVGYFIDEINTITKGARVRSRDGFEVDITFLDIKQFAIYRRQGEAARILALNSMGQLYDLTTSTMIYSNPEMKGFAINYANNRAIISPHNYISGLPGEFTYIYDGTGIVRKAGGKAPVAGFVVTPAGTGNIEKGKHIFAVVFETNTGFVTAPGPAEVIEFEGTTAVDFSSIPIGPTGTIARRIIASRAIQDYNGDIEGYEMFFVPGGRINNNVDTTLNGINFWDADLQLSADYVYDQLDELPAVLFITTYGNRMCYGCPNADKNMVWISNPLDPEAIHNAAGFVVCDPFETNGVKDATEYRNNLYIVKRNKTYVTTDNTYEPATWKVITIDSAIGGDINSIARFYDSTGSRVEFFTVSSPTGMQKFSGIYEPLSMSRNITMFWDRINKKYMHKMQTIIDQEKMLFYIIAPIDESAENNIIFVGNFENGFTSTTVKWHMWHSNAFEPSSIGIDRHPDTGETVFKVSSLSGNIYRQALKRKDDNGVVIPSLIQFALVATAPHTITHCGAVGFRVKGAGELLLELRGQDDVDFQILHPIPLFSCNPGKEYTRLAHFQSEKVSLKIATNNFGAWFVLNRIDLFLNQIFVTRPIVK